MTTPPVENPLELGPDLPVTVFTSTERWHPERIGALALYCSDGRWGDAFDEFCHKHLQIPRYDRWAVPGGPAVLVDGGDVVSRAAFEQIDFLVRAHELEQVVIITHYGCAHYAERLNQPPRECLPAQFADVHAAAALLRGRHPHLRIGTYLAMRSGSCLSFHQISDKRGA